MGWMSSWQPHACASDWGAKWVREKSYLLEPLTFGRHPQIDAAAPTPFSGWKESYDDGETQEEEPDPDQIKSAQSLTGELLWLVVRARPELSFPVSRMAQLSARRPGDAINIGQGVLKFLKGSVSSGLLFGPLLPDVGLHQAEKFAKPVREHSLQVFSDASFGPASGKSHQGLVVSWGGAPIHWESSRQTLVALSTAEAELIAMVSAVQAGEAVASLISEIIGRVPEKQLFGDNSAAISIVSGPPTSWRTRHLRLRSSALREKLEGGSWSLHHLAGEGLCADMLTKALGAQRFAALLPMVGSYDATPPRVSTMCNAEQGSRWKQAAVVLWTICMPQLLKGSALTPATFSRDDVVSWFWIAGIVVGIVLFWEATKAAVRPCLRALGLSAHEQALPVDVRVTVDQTVSTPPVPDTGLRDVAASSTATPTTARALSSEASQPSSSRPANRQGPPRVCAYLTISQHISQ